MSNIAKNPTEMTTGQIVAYLNSGKYIPSTIRKLLEEKVEQDKKVNKLSGIDEFFAMISPNAKINNKDSKHNNSNKKEDVVEYPELVNATHISSQNQASLNFASIVNIQNNGKKKFKKPLFVDKHLILEYSDIDTMYNKFAIYRIKMSYLLCVQKIKLIEELQKTKYIEANILKNELDYDMLIDKEKELKQCLDIYITLNNYHEMFNKQTGLLLILDKMINMFDDSLKLKEIKDDLKELNNYYQKFDTIEEKLVNHFQKYTNIIAEGSKLFKKIVSELFTYDTDTLNVQITNITKFLNRLEKTIYEIVQVNDTHLVCEYYVYLQSSNDESIILSGLATSFYLSCDEEINMHVNKYLLNPNIYKNMLVSDILNMLDKQFKDDTYYFLNLYEQKYTTPLRINFYFNEEITKTMVTLKINNLPKNSKYLSCMMRNYKMDKKITVPKVTPIINPYKYWLGVKSHNPLYQIDEDDYNTLDEDLSTRYTRDDTDKNIFTIEYLFNDLMNNDVDNSLILPNMVESFKKLAYHTSY